ncbi:MAG: hypothetical protein L0Y32_01545, partial [Nevskiales bacterium]|nr:hypothetical protein [Nevskiales bacterium]
GRRETKTPCRRTVSPFTVIAHRGARGYAPENTLKAFEQAIALGAPWIELDVQLHQQVLWVFHDRRLERCTNGRGRLTDHDVNTLRRLDAGQGQRIPFLAEVLDLVHHRAGINIELKTAEGTAAAVAELLRGYLDRGWTPDEFLVSSFHLPELREFRRRLPQVPVGVLLCGVPLDLAASATRLKARCVNLDVDFADPALIDDAHRRGLKVFVYTVNEPDDIALMRRRVDGIFTDYPDRALSPG